jgi:tetratricopeptide (TPR) repeat protein
MGRGRAALAGILIAAAAWAAYANSFSGPFVFDDILGIQRNPSIRRLWPLTGPLHPQTDTTLSGRPVASLSFAVSYHLGGQQVEGYHWLNLAIHILAGLALFGIVRRTLDRMGTIGGGGTGGPPVRVAARAEAEADGRAARPFLMALIAALWWTLHPLQTEAVTYLVQRVESLMGLFYLLTLYCFIRGLAGKGGWFVLAVLACLLGMGTKEVMISAPFLVFLYDRTFVAGSFREAWKRRWRVHLALLATTGWVIALAIGTNSRNGTSGFGVGVRAWDYYLTQFPAVARYLGLALWPRNLVFDYGTVWVTRPLSVLPAAALVAALAAGTIWALRYRPVLGFLGAWFFAILAPTSLIPGNRQTMAEHRMYLALAPVAVLGAWGLVRLSARLFSRGAGRANRAAAVAGLAVAGILGVLTARRNDVFRSNQALWEDTIAKLPANPYPHNNLGNVYMGENRTADALAQYREVVRLKPDYPEGHNNLGTALLKSGRKDEALAEFQEAKRLKPDYPDLENNIGVALLDSNLPQAIAEFREILRRDPDYAEAHFNLGNALGRAGHADQAVAQYREALRLGVDLPEVHNNLGIALAALGRVPEAEQEYVTALRMDPHYAEAYANLGNVLLKAGKALAAIHEYQSALRWRPAYADAHFNLANALALTGALADAEAEYRAALRLRPAYAAAHLNLGNVLMADGQIDAATGEFAETVRLQPDNGQAHNNLGAAYLRQGRLDEAQWQFAEALRLKPDYPAARANLSKAQARLRAETAH